MRSTLDAGRTLRLSRPLARWDGEVIEVDEARVEATRDRRKLKFTLLTSFVPPGDEGVLTLARSHGPLSRRVAVRASGGRVLEVSEI